MQVAKTMISYFAVRTEIKADQTVKEHFLRTASLVRRGTRERGESLFRRLFLRRK